MLENPRSPRVRAVAKLRKKQERTASGLFLLEGPQSVAEALGFRPQLLVEMYATPTAFERHLEIAEVAMDAGVGIEFVSEGVLEAMADTVTPQGFVAVCRQFPTAVKEIFAASPMLIVVLEEVRDPGNAGTIVRAADAAGADAVIFTGRSVDLYNPKLVRSTTGSIFHLPIAVDVELSDVVARAREAGLTVLAADLSGEELTTVLPLLKRPTAWVFGNEARGLSPEHSVLCDHAVRVPIYGHAESMNLATAASVCVYQSAFAQRV